MNRALASSSLIVEDLNNASRTHAFKLGYHPELDGLRGVSILLVLAHHLELWSQWHGGFLGVDIFFVLSGFLITSLLLQEWQWSGRISLKRFYIRRVLRLMPALYLLMLLLGLYAFIFLDAKHAVNIYYSILVTSLYASNWVLAFNYGYQLGPLAITWSLAIEEQFYLLWPSALTLALRLKLRERSIFFGLALIILLIVLHRSMLWQEGASISRVYYATDTRVDSILTGCLAGLLVAWNFWPKMKRLGFYMRCLAIIAAIFAIYQIITASPRDGQWFAGRYILFSLAIAQIITVILLWPPKIALMVLRWEPLAWVGRISYGLYLWHWAILSLIFPRDGSQPSIFQMMEMVVFSFTAATLSFYLVEKPFLRWKRRFNVY
ncbi:MAG TPA: acyltransferase [Pyrinomonadaceae bacterium]|nr:acyltransferase [Pyrinomonadaceae bacterium]